MPSCLYEDCLNPNIARLWFMTCPCSLSNQYWIFRYIVNINTFKRERRRFDYLMWKKKGKLTVKSPQAPHPSQFLHLHNILLTFHTSICHSSIESSPQINKTDSRVGSLACHMIRALTLLSTFSENVCIYSH